MKGLSQKSINLINLSQESVDNFNATLEKVLKTAQDSIFNKVSEECQKANTQREHDIESILRNNVTPPIKGEITSGKLHWRGITSIIYGECMSFRGIEQRGYLIDINGNKTKINK